MTDSQVLNPLALLASLLLVFGPLVTVDEFASSLKGELIETLEEVKVENNQYNMDKKCVYNHSPSSMKPIYNHSSSSPKESSDITGGCNEMMVEWPGTACKFCNEYGTGDSCACGTEICVIS